MARNDRRRRALISVTDKTDLEMLGKGLVELGFELVSTGGTANALRSFGLPVTDVAEVTKFPEMMEGRLKTLHPNIFGGILGRPSKDSDMASLNAHAIELFGVVAVNLYAFSEKAKDKSLSFDELVEHIDIGGPSLIRAAGKNWRHVYVVTEKEQYEKLLEVLKNGDPVDQMSYRFELMREAFEYTASYDEWISHELDSNWFFNTWPAEVRRLG